MVDMNNTKFNNRLKVFVDQEVYVDNVDTNSRWYRLVHSNNKQ